MCKQSKIKKGQIWRSKDKNYCILVGKKLKKDDCWLVYPHCHKNGGKVHKMQDGSFHFYELVEDD